MMPSSYQAYDQEGNKMVGDGKQEYFLANRSFEEVNAYFSGQIGQSIVEMYSKNPQEKINILDLAGGTKSQAIKDINEIYGPRVNAFNVDIVHNVQQDQNVLRVQGSATELPIANESMDVIYCRQFLPFLNRFNRDHSLQVERVLAEVARILKPGGIAFLDDEEEISGLRSQDKISALEQKFGVVIKQRDSASYTEERQWPKFWKKVARPAKFLTFEKPANQKN